MDILLLCILTLPLSGTRSRVQQASFLTEACVQGNNVVVDCCCDACTILCAADLVYVRRDAGGFKPCISAIHIRIHSYSVHTLHVLLVLAVAVVVFMSNTRFFRGKFYEDYPSAR